MRVAFVTSEHPLVTGPLGGLGQYTRRTSRLLAAQGWDVHVFVAAPHEATDRAIDDHGVHVQIAAVDASPPVAHAASLHPAVRAQLASTFTALDLVRQAHAVRVFDLVQVPHVLPFADAAAGLPLLVRLSGDDRLWRVADGAHATFDALRSEWLNVRAVARAPLVVAPSRWLARRSRHLAGRPADVLRPIAMLELDRSEWDEAWAAETADEAHEHLVFVGGASGRKGFDTFIEAASTLLRRRETLVCHLVGVAAVPPAAATEFGERLRAYGSLSHERLYPLLARARAAHMPYRVDNWSNAIVEAIVIGVPVVTTRDTACEELVHDPSRLHGAGDAEEAAHALERVFEWSEAARHARTTQARDELMREASLDATLEGYSALARRVVREGAAATSSSTTSARRGMFASCAALAATVATDASRQTLYRQMVGQLLDRDVRRVIVWGAGAKAKSALEQLIDAGIDIVAVTDANTALAGQQVAGYHVTPPSALRSVEADALFVAVVGESAAVLADARPVLHPSVALAVCPSTAPITIAPSRGIEEAEQGRPHAEC